jgi:thioredoxin-related protein
MMPCRRPALLFCWRSSQDLPHFLSSRLAVASVMDAYFHSTKMKSPLSLLTALVFSAAFAFAKGPEAVTNLDQALSSASAEQKMTFLLLGRPTCSICNGTKALIHDGKISVTAQHFVMADLNIDDRAVNSEFMQKFKGQNFGNTLPFVVITDPSGKLLASSGGYKTADQWNLLLREAKKKAGPTAGASGSADSFSVFKTTPAAKQ